MIVICGKDRGKKGKVVRRFKREHKIIVEGLNLVMRHRRPRREREKGQRVEVSAPLDISNVKILCPKCGQATRVGYRLEGEGPKQRYCKKCQQAIA